VIFGGRYLHVLMAIGSALSMFDNATVPCLAEGRAFAETD